MHQITGSATPDAIGSILVGVLLGVVAVVLINRNRQFLVGEEADPRVRSAAVRALLEMPEVARVTYLRLEVVGPRMVFVTGDVDLTGDDTESHVAVRLRALEAKFCASPAVAGAVPASRVGSADRGRLGWTHDLRERRTYRFPTKSSRSRRDRRAQSESGGLVVGRLVLEPGWRWSEHVRPIAGTTSCQFHHVGLTLSGAMDGRMDDGTEFEVRPGDVFDVPPGHDNWVIGDEPLTAIIWGGWRGWGKPPVGERILTTMLITDIAGSTDRAAAVGDAAWDQLSRPSSRTRPGNPGTLPRDRDRHCWRRIPDHVRRRCTRRAAQRWKSAPQSVASALISGPGSTPERLRWSRGA